MALVLKDRVLETCTSPGTGTITLLGAVTGYQAFSTVGNGNTCYYAIADQNGANWEVGIGTYSSGTLARTTVLSSSNAGSLTNFSTGSQNVFLTYPSERSVNLSSAALTSGRVTYATTDGLLTDSAGLTFDGTTFQVTGKIAVSGANPSIRQTVQNSQLDLCGGTTVGTDPSIQIAGSTTGFGDANTIFYNTNTHIFRTTSGVTERMRITSAGNVGIGTTTPDVFSRGYTGTIVGISSTSGETALMVNSSGTNVVAFEMGRAGSRSTLLYDTTTATEFGTLTSKPLKLLTNGAVVATLDTSGNLGLGVTPSAWGSNYKAIQIGAQTCLYNAVGYVTSLNTNAYEDSVGALLRIAAGEATRYTQAGGVHAWFNAPNGSAGAVATFTQAMTLDSSGNLGLGVTPSAWASANPIKAIQVGRSGSISYDNGSASTNIVAGAYLSATGQWTKIGTTGAAKLALSDYDGSFLWSRAASGSGNFTYTDVMTLDASGNLLVGGTTAYGKFTVRGYKTITTFGNVSASFSDDASSTFYVSHPSGAVLLSSDTALAFGAGSGAASVERMRITSAGNVGIGTSSPSSANGSDRFLVIAGSASADVASLVLDPHTGNAHEFQSYNGTLKIFNSTTQQMTLDASNRLIVNGTSPYSTAVITAQETASLGNGIAIKNRNSTQTWLLTVDSLSVDDKKLVFVDVAGGPTGRMTLYPNGDVEITGLAGVGSRAVTVDSAGVLSAVSDSSLKEEVTNAHIAGLAEIMQIHPKMYRWKNDIVNRGNNAAIELGFFANEVAPIIPSAAPKGKDGLYGFYDRSITAALVKSIQEQQALIESLTTRLTALESA